ncbi:MAG: tripartite tricarboxylate transporter permease [Rhodoplanes sp.]|uniref:tripartite tricarboxylate transporter permease n=1 Tax=Rhodoplanes sp. TaxID=1968906 RepID=UPI001846040A|nr:tripartite tricarboxylate transporter permease [Rhodoplanes sp.]NVO12623.1 tripartite tricarboxylate transporter permease [Rhodoplanes sp.]
MESLELLMGGFATALQPGNLLFALIGCTLGTLIGVLPGIGPAAGTAILIPIAMAISPTSAIIMLAAIYYGAMYGGTITSVLINTPGEAASAVTCLDGYAMAKQGRAGAALAVAAIGSFVGGTVAVGGLVLVALPLTRFALRFGPPEFFALMIVGLSLVTGLAGRSLVRALLSAILGLMIAQVGIDPVMGAPRFTFGHVELMDGFGIVPVVMGVFGIGEILFNVEAGAMAVFSPQISRLMPSRADLDASKWPIVRGTVVGFLMGLIPGVGAIVPTFVSYAMEKRLSKTPERFGTGMIEGVAGPETANNAYANAALIPLFTLGIPGSPTTAILMGAFMMNGLVPGPMLFKEHGEFAWAVIASLYIGNIILVILNLPLIPLWVKFLKIPYGILMAIVFGFSVIGVYSLNSSVFDIGIMLGFGIIGYAFRKMDIPLAPMILTFVLGPLMERGLRQSLEMSQGDISILVTRPLSATLLVIATLVIVSSMFRAFSAVKGDTEV